ncbi:MAG: hypothetical protein HY725_08750 [Candidatus Rokubacteria bacterium]|nr:hypothetical protein [Candidatus Rokubacteria bacterium]
MPASAPAWRPSPRPPSPWRPNPASDRPHLGHEDHRPSRHGRILCRGGGAVSAGSPRTADRHRGDLSSLGDFERAEKHARALKAEIFEREGLACSVGIGPNKLVAKIASDFEKPDGLTVVRPEEVQGYRPLRRLRDSQPLPYHQGPADDPGRAGEPGAPAAPAVPRRPRESPAQETPPRRGPGREAPPGLPRARVSRIDAVLDRHLLVKPRHILF